MPKADKKKLADTAKPDERSRLQVMVADGLEPDLPPNPAPHLVDILMEVGPVEATGMGAAVVSWSEIHAWQADVSRPLEPWEARLIRHLSAEFLNESRRAEKADSAPPWTREPTEDRRNVVAQKLAAAFNRLR